MNLSVARTGEAGNVNVQTTSGETAEHVTGSTNDEVVGDNEDDEVVASRDPPSVTMATADASRPLSVTVELPYPPCVTSP